MQHIGANTRVVVADHQFLIKEGLQKIWSDTSGYELVFAGHSMESILAYCSENPCDLLILDLTLVRSDHFKALRKNPLGGPSLIILCDKVSREEFSMLSQAGAQVIVHKATEREEFFRAVKASLSGKRYISSAIYDMVLASAGMTDNSASLTGAEKDIVCLIAEGLTTKEISQRIHISYHTVMTHRKNIFRKLGVKNVSELVRYALKRGMIDHIEYYI
jgi:DNA-binding NarL/FixJ family response regulator